MNYTDVMNALKTASLFDLFRLGIAISHEVESPDRIKAVRQAFKAGDTVSFFDETENMLRSAVVMEKNIKYVSLIDKAEKRIWKVPYCFLNLGNVNTDIHCERHEKLTKNHLKIGDCVGFNKDGEQISGVVTRLNYKTVSLITGDGRRWRAGYSCLYKIIDADLAKHVAELSLID
jgi:hypothetical protein